MILIVFGHDPGINMVHYAGEQARPKVKTVSIQADSMKSDV